MTIPLLKPDIPKPYKWAHFLKESYDAGIFSNFGPNYIAACQDLVKLEQYKGLHPVLVNNGTTAIQVALQTTFKRGAKIAIPHYTFAATLNAVLAAGMIPVIVQCDPITWSIDMALLFEHKNEFDGFIVVSPMGHSVNVNYYDKLSREIKRPVIYDFAAAVFNPISHSNPTTLSFHATKNLPIGEGGAVLYPNKEDADRATQLISFDFDIFKQPITAYGFNGKLDELHCALLRYQLGRPLQWEASRKIAITLEYTKHLGEWFTPHVNILTSHPQLTVLQSRDSSILVQATNELNKVGIAHRLYYNPTLFEMMATLDFKQIRSGKPVLQAGLALPSFKGAPIKAICEVIKKGI